MHLSFIWLKTWVEIILSFRSKYRLFKCMQLVLRRVTRVLCIRCRTRGVKVGWYNRYYIGWDKMANGCSWIFSCVVNYAFKSTVFHGQLTAWCRPELRANKEIVLKWLNPYWSSTYLHLRRFEYKEVSRIICSVIKSFSKALFLRNSVEWILTFL